MATIDLSALMRTLEEEEQEAERALHVAQLRLSHIRGQRKGLERTIEAINQQAQPIMTEGGG